MTTQARNGSARSRRLKAVVVAVIVVVLIGVLLGSFGASSGSGSSVDRSAKAGCQAFEHAMGMAGQAGASQQGSTANAEVSAVLQGALSELEQAKDVTLAQDATLLDAALTSSGSAAGETNDVQAVTNQCSADGF